MTAAIFGLLGVIVGGFINAWATAALERRRERRAARTAGRLVLAETTRAAMALANAKTDSSWLPIHTDIVDDQWQRHRELLATALSWDDWHAVWAGGRTVERLAHAAAQRVERGGDAIRLEQDLVPTIDQGIERAAEAIVVLAKVAVDGPHRRPVYSLYRRVRERIKPTPELDLDELADEI